MDTREKSSLNAVSEAFWIFVSVSTLNKLCTLSFTSLQFESISLWLKSCGKFIQIKVLLWNASLFSSLFWSIRNFLNKQVLLAQIMIHFSSKCTYINWNCSLIVVEKKYFHTAKFIAASNVIDQYLCIGISFNRTIFSQVCLLFSQYNDRDIRVEPVLSSIQLSNLVYCSFTPNFNFRMKTTKKLLFICLVRRWFQTNFEKFSIDSISTEFELIKKWPFCLRCFFCTTLVAVIILIRLNWR